MQKQSLPFERAMMVCQVFSQNIIFKTRYEQMRRKKDYEKCLYSNSIQHNMMYGFMKDGFRRHLEWDTIHEK